MSDDTKNPAADAPSAAPPAVPATRQTALPFVRDPAPTVSVQVIDEIAAARKAAESEAAARKALAAEHEELKATLAKKLEELGMSERQKAEASALRKAETIRNAANLAAVKHGAVSESQLVKLVLDDLDMTDTGAVVAKTDAKVDADAFVASYLKDNPHLAKPRVAAGGGTNPFPGVAPSALPVSYDTATATGLTNLVRSFTYRRGETPRPAPTLVRRDA